MDGMIPERAQQTEEDNDNWENEDPNLLNNHALLYKECEKLPLPVEGDVASDEEFYEVMCIMRDLILDNNVVLEAISKKEEIYANKEAACQVMENLKTLFHAESLKCLNKIVEKQNMPSWDDSTKLKVFSKHSVERIQRWKRSLNEFLESYLKIREFIPKGILEETERTRTSENMKEQTKHFPLLVKELDHLLQVLETFAD